MAHGTDRIAYLDGIRGIAIASVIAVHWGFAYNSPFRGGYIGVDVFFVLSGFIISRIVWRGRDSFHYGRFLKGRFRRLYPALIGVVVVGGPLIAVASSLSVEQVAVGGLFALAQVNTFVGATGAVSTEPFGITWSLSAEWVSYLVLPLLVVAGARLGARRLAVVLVAVAGCLYLASTAGDSSWFYYGPIARGAQLLAGSALALWTEGREWNGRAPRLAPIAGVIALIAFISWTVLGAPETSALYRLVGFPLATWIALALIFNGLASPGSVVHRGLSAGPLAALGRASYSVYLWHVVPLAVIWEIGRFNMTMPVFLLCSLAFVTVASGASYHLLERRFMRSRSSAITDRTNVDRATI